jgi:hypothetical protein
MRYGFCGIAWLVVLLTAPAWAADPKDKKADPKKDAAAAQAAPKAADKGDVKKDDAKKGDAKKDDKKGDPKKGDPKKGDAGKTTTKPGARPGLGRPGMPGMRGPPANSNTEKMVRSGVVTGRVTAVMEDKKAVRIEVTMYVAKPNPGAAQSIMQAQINLANATTPQAIFQAQQQMMQARSQLVTYQSEQKEYELEATDECKIRLAQPPPQFDDKGRIKRYTPAELRALKGDDPKLPGYSGEFGSLRQDQIVQVTLVRKKDAARPRPGPRPQGKEGEVDLLAEHLPQMSMVVVVHEPKDKP